MALLTLATYWSSVSVPGLVTVTFNTVTKAVDTDIVEPAEGEPTEEPGTYEPEVGGVLYEQCDGPNLDRVTYDGLDHFTYSVETDSPICYTGCTLLITNVATTPETLYNQDGSVTVTVSGGTAPLFFSLDNITFQSTGSFAGLAKGAYTIYVRDSSEPVACLASQAFEITRTVFYGPRYRLDYDDIHGTPASLLIEEFGYLGPVEYVCGTGSPAVLGVDAKDSLYAPVLASFLEINLLNEYDQGAGKFMHLAMGDERTFRVTHTLEGTILFKGHIEPSIYTEPYLSPTYEVSFTATDGLAALKDAPFAYADGEPIRGRMSVLAVLLECLGHTDTDLPLLIACDVYAEGMDLSLDPLSQAFVDPAAFLGDKGEPGDCYAVLEEVLKPFGGNLFQENGAWWVVTRDAHRYPLTVHAYDPDGTYLSNAPYSNYQTFGPPPAEPFFIENSQRLDVAPAYHRTDVVADLGVVKNIIPRGNFYAYDFAPQATLAPLAPGYADALKDWAYTFTAPRIVESAKDGVNSLYLPPATHNPRLSPQLYIESPAIPVQVRMSDTGFFELVLEVEVTGEGNDGVTWYMQFYTPEGFSLKGTVEPGMMADYEYTPDGYVTLSPQKKREKEKLTLRFLTGEQGDYYLRFYAPYSPNQFGREYGLKIHGMSLRYYPGGNQPLDQETVTVENGRRYTTGAYAVETRLGDVPPADHYASVWHGYVDTALGLPGYWFRKAFEEQLGLLQILASRVAYNKGTPTRRLTGTLRGRVGIGSALKDALDYDRLYVPVGLSYDVKARTAQVTLDEVVTVLDLGGDTYTKEYNEAEYNAAEYN